MKYVNSVGGNPMNYVDPTGLKIFDYTNDSRVKKMLKDPLYKTLHNNPNVNIVVLSANLPKKKDLAKTLGTSKSIMILLDLSKLSSDYLYMNTYFHELLHAQSLVSGNFSYSDESRKDFNFEEDNAYSEADRKYNREGVCDYPKF